MEPSLSPTPVPKQDKKAFYIILGIGIAGLIIGFIGLFSLLSMPISKVTKDGTANVDSAPAGALTIGSAPYAYGCSVLHRDDIKSATSQLNDTMMGESAKSTQAIPAAQMPDKQYDLLKTYEGLALGTPTIKSECQYSLDLDEDGMRKSVHVTLMEYNSGLEALRQFNAKKSYMEGAKSFKSLPQTSLIDPQNGKFDETDPDSVRSFLVAKNVLIEFQYSFGDSTPEEAPTKLDALASKLVDNVKNVDSAIKAPDFTDVSANGSTKFIDACHALQFSNISTLYGGIEYERSGVEGTHTYGKTDPTSKSLRSECRTNFRYQEDSSKQPDLKKQHFTGLGTRYPNSIDLEVIAYASPAEAQAALTKEKQALPEKTLLRPFDFSYGNTSMAYTQESGLSKVKSTITQYKAVKGAYVIEFAIDQGQVTDPYQSTVKTVTNDQAKQLYDSFKF